MGEEIGPDALQGICIEGLDNAIENGRVLSSAMYE